MTGIADSEISVDYKHKYNFIKKTLCDKFNHDEEFQIYGANIYQIVEGTDLEDSYDYRPLITVLSQLQKDGYIEVVDHRRTQRLSTSSRVIPTSKALNTSSRELNKIIAAAIDVAATLLKIVKL